MARKVLVVDDEEYVLKIFQYNFESAGYQVITALDGYEAIDIVKKENPDIIFMDIKMPGISGLEASRQIKSINPNIPVVIVTGYQTPASLKEAADLGVYRYVLKPFEIKDLLEMIDQIFSSSAG